MRHLLALLALLLLAPIPAAAQGMPKDIADTFFARLKTGEYQKAYTDIWGESLMKSKPMEVANVINQMEIAFRTYGAPEGYEVVSEEIVAPSLHVNTYLVRTPIGPLFFRVQFYRYAQKWTVYRLDFADMIGRLPPANRAPTS
ncbi:MAG: hypothetical protein DI570_01100 [Phenylobacterium zucineum]|nr:MAG: hypothetical protein DI570_01100 [Phenylobacterium zucineum]